MYVYRGSYLVWGEMNSRFIARGYLQIYSISLNIAVQFM